MNAHPRRGRRAFGFTLIELLVVITIILLVSVIALTTIPGLVGDYQVTEGARLVQAALASARDVAIRTGDNHGIRLVYDPTLSDPFAIDPSSATLTTANGGPHSRLVFNKIVPIEPAPDLSDGMLTFVPSTAFWSWNKGAPPTYPIGAGQTYPFFNAVQSPTQYAALGGVNPILMVAESVFQGNSALTSALPNPPVNWFWNIRIGDRLRFNDAGQYYTVVGPMTIANPEQYVNNGNPGAPLASTEALTFLYPTAGGGQLTVYPQYLFLVNGQDDNGNGYVDEGYNGVDENYNGMADDIGEWYGLSTLGNYPSEIETWQGSQLQQSLPLGTTGFPQESAYTIKRRPVPSQGAREFQLPSTVVIDDTTWNARFANPALLAERSRLPDPNNGTIDIMLNPSGQVIPTTIYSTPAGTSMSVGNAFYHFWIADRTDVYDPAPIGNTFSFPMLPFPQSVGNYNPPTNPANATLAGRFLKKDRQLVTLFTRTGQVVTNSINNFYLETPPKITDANYPFYDAQQGIREAK